MPLGSSHATNTTAATFIPQLWSDETIAAYKVNTVMANLVTKIEHEGSKGDTINIPMPVRANASVKAAQTQVTLIAPTEGTMSVTINKHYEYSYLFEDKTMTQALESYRGFYTDDAGYALARQVDQDLHLLGVLFQGGAVDVSSPFSAQYNKAVIGSDGLTNFLPTANTNTGNGAALTDLGIRRIIQTLDDANEPMSGRVLVIPPVEKKNLLGINRFTEHAFVGEGPNNSIRTGLIGDVYGIPVYVSSNCPWLWVDAADGDVYANFVSTAPSGTDAFGNTVAIGGATTKYRAGMMFHRGALALATQLSVRTQAQYKQEYLGWLYTSDMLYGVSKLRDYAGVAVVVPA